MRRLLLVLAVVFCARAAAARDLTLYADALAAGWADWSYDFPGIVVDFASTAQVHDGTAAMAVTFGAAYDGLSLRVSPPIDTAAYTAVRFWIYGAGADGTQLDAYTQSSDDSGLSSTNSFTAPAGVWTQVEIPFAAFGSPAAIARISLQDADFHAGETFWVDQLELVAAQPPPLEAIFSDDFESGSHAAWCGPLGCGGGGEVSLLTITSGTTDVNGTPRPSRTFAWTDAAGLQRSAVMIDGRTTAPIAPGYMRRITYRVGGVDRVITAYDGNGGVGGFGFVTNHVYCRFELGCPWGNWTVGSGATTSLPLAGAHHAIVRYSLPGYTLWGRVVPTTVEWFFATGRSHPIFTAAQDARAHAGNLGGDSRSPYGTMTFSGDGSNALVGGVSWGDTFKFVTLTPNTASESTILASTNGWRYTEPNVIPYVLAWTNGIDAEQGAVATRSIAAQDQGADPREWVDPPGAFTGFGKNQQDANGPLPADDDWAYQMMNYPDVPPGGTYDKKMAWGTNPGFLGGFDNYDAGAPDVQSFSRHRDSTTPFTGTRENGMLASHSTFVVFGPHGGGYLTGATGQTVTQMENHAAATFTATVGTVRTSGPRGVGVASDVVVAYSPAGYNHVYATWDVDAAADAATVKLTVQAGKPIDHPVFVVHGYGGATAPAVTLEGVAATPNVDYALTLDAANDRVWITVLRTVTVELDLAVTP